MSGGADYFCNPLGENGLQNKTNPGYGALWEGKGKELWSLAGKENGEAWGWMTKSSLLGETRRKNVLGRENALEKKKDAPQFAERPFWLSTKITRRSR